MKFFAKLILTLALAVSLKALAGTEKTFGVSGMVCSFCSQGIEKSFRALPEVQEVHVSLAEKRLRLVFKDGQSLTEEKVEQVLKASGYKLLKEGS